MEFKANWVRPARDLGDVCPVFKKEWRLIKPLKAAELFLTARGVYEARINGKRVSGYVLAPGWTSYEKRLQVQRYDVTELLQEDNILTVTVGRGWMRSPMPGFVESEDKKRRVAQPCGLWGELHLLYEDGGREILAADETWEYGESGVRFSEIYDGEQKVGEAIMVFPGFGSDSYKFRVNEAEDRYFARRRTSRDPHYRKETVKIRGICLNCGEQGKNYTVKFRPGDLWIMEQ